MTSRNHDDVRDQPARETYVVYNLTPNMWEEPWVRHLLAELPIARYETLDLWSPPPVHPRRRRLFTTFQSLLPGPVRPTRWMLRRIVQPHEFSVFVYNTWGLDCAVRAEFPKLLSHLEHVGIVSVDEPSRDSGDTYKHVTFALRIGFNGKKYHAIPNLLVAPLGVPNNFVPPSKFTNIRERTFSWSFLGEVKNVSRKAMITQLRNVAGDSFLHEIGEWNSQESLRGAQYSQILADSVFVPSPPANVHRECYRTYEALECDAIPVVDTRYYRDEFRAPFPIVQPTWENAPEMLNWLLSHTDALTRLHQECRSWWEGMKKNYPGKVRVLADQARPMTQRRTRLRLG